MIASLFSGIKAEWRNVAGQTPGRRFIHYYRYAQRSPSTVKTALRIAIGAVLVAVGAVLWFTPGPGWLFVIFGLAMFAAQFRPLARFLDRSELVARERGRQLLRWLRGR